MSSRFIHREHIQIDEEYVKRAARKAWEEHVKPFISRPDSPVDYAGFVIERIAAGYKEHSTYFLNRLNSQDMQIHKWIREELSKG